jgi:hypothetical protein
MPISLADDTSAARFALGAQGPCQSDHTPRQPTSTRSSCGGQAPTMTRLRAVWSIKAAAIVLGAVLIAGCAAPTSSPGGATTSGGQGASRSSAAHYSGPSCSICIQLMSQFPVLATLTLAELADLLELYGPDLAKLLVAAALIAGAG